MNFKQSLGWPAKYSPHIQHVSFWTSITAVFIAIYDLGFRKTEVIDNFIIRFYLAALAIGCISIVFRYIYSARKTNLKVKIIDFVIIVLFIFLFLIRAGDVKGFFNFIEFFNHKGWLHLSVFLYFIREFSNRRIEFTRSHLNPAQLFILSFLFIIGVGTVLLMLPKATHNGISLIDALFTSTSAVCVTGLIVVDTGSYFTDFGQTVIVVLIQLGGLGIMTFASYFSYFFRGQSSYENQLMMQDMGNMNKIGEVFSVLKKIILLTFFIELIGAILVFFNIDKNLVGGTFGDEIFFSVFHTISGFCNAGFSTLPNGLYEPGFRFNYPLQIILALLFILGGLGFPIILNVFSYFKHLLVNRILPLHAKQQSLYRPWVININSRIVLSTTFILLVGGTFLIYFLEYDNTLAIHKGFGKVVTAFFGAATPRTAGFNTIDTSALHFSTLMVVILLMWIGASPGSTGGGIKTSTFAIATLNFLSLAKGKNRIEIYKRQVADISVQRAFALISLSLLVIGMGTILIVTFDPDKTPLQIAFECFSAYSTVGLSMGITAHLSEASKMVVVGLMFIGRVSMLTILIAFLRKVRHLNYRYPSEEILIN